MITNNYITIIKFGNALGTSKLHQFRVQIGDFLLPVHVMIIRMDPKTSSPICNQPEYLMEGHRFSNFVSPVLGTTSL